MRVIMRERKSHLEVDAGRFKSLKRWSNDLDLVAGSGPSSLSLVSAWSFGPTVDLFSPSKKRLTQTLQLPHNYAGE